MLHPVQGGIVCIYKNFTDVDVRNLFWRGKYQFKITFWRRTVFLLSVKKVLYEVMITIIRDSLYVPHFGSLNWFAAGTLIALQSPFNKRWLAFSLYFLNGLIRGRVKKGNFLYTTLDSNPIFITMESTLLRSILCNLFNMKRKQQKDFSFFR